jgi:hypothetical protein
MFNYTISLLAVQAMKLLSILVSLSLAASSSAASFFEDLSIQQSDGNSLLRKKNRRRGLSKLSNNHRALEVSEECLNADSILEQAIVGNEENLALLQAAAYHMNCPFDCGEGDYKDLCTVGLGNSPAYMEDLQAWTDLCESFDARIVYADYERKDDAVAAGANDILLRNAPDCWPNVCSDDEVWELYGMSDSNYTHTPSDMTFYSKPPKGCNWVWSDKNGNMSEKRSKASKAAKAAKAMEGLH